MFNNYNPYMMQQQRFQPNDAVNQPLTNAQFNTQPFIQTPVNNQNVLLGKSVDNIEVVRAMDIPLDGSTSYFPLTDGSAIVTKKLQIDGTSKIIVYKPVEDTNKNQPNYVTFEDLNKIVPDIDITDIEDLKEDMKEIKKQLKDMKKNKGE